MKPTSMSHKEWMIKKLSLQLVISEKIIESVINNQFDTAYDALPNNNSIEFSGFGKFVFNHKRAIKMMAKFEMQKEYYTKELENTELTIIMRGRTEKKLQTALNNIKELKPKLL